MYSKSNDALPRPARPCVGLRCVGLQALAALAAGASAAMAAPVPPAPSGNYADLSLEQLMDLKVERVYGVSKHVQRVTQAPSSVSIVTADDIRQFGWRTLADILRSVRGFYASDDRNYSYVGVRGFLRPGDYNTRLLVLVDGHRMNDNVYDGAYIGREAMIATDLIERVEVIRGPSSSVYGSSAFFGVINLVTKKPVGGAHLTTEIGDRDTFEARLTFDHKFNHGLEWRISATHFSTGGEDRLYFAEFDPRISGEPAAANNGVAVDLDAERSAHLFSSLHYKDVTVSAFVSRRRKDVPTASFATIFNHGTERTYDRRAYLDMKLDRALGEHRLLGRVFYDQYRYDGRYPFDYAAPGDAAEVFIDADGAIGEWVGTEWQLNARLSDAHSVALGAEFRRNLREDQFAAYEGVTSLDDRRASKTLGLFAEWEARLRKDVLLTAGVRHDRYYNSFGGTTNPRLGLIYQLSEVATVKALYGRAFRAPNPYESYYYELQASRPGLRPERIETHELVFERYWGHIYRAGVSLYHYHVDDLVTQSSTPADELFFQNAGATHATGVEIESEARYDSGWLVRGSMAWQRAQDTMRREDLSSSPHRLAKLNVAWAPSGRGFSAGLEVQHQSKSRTLSGAQSDAFTLMNLNLITSRLIPACEISLTAWNLLDARYDMPGAADHVPDVLAQPRRALRLKLTHSF